MKIANLLFVILARAASACISSLLKRTFIFLIMSFLHFDNRQQHEIFPDISFRSFFIFLLLEIFLHEVSEYIIQWALVKFPFQL